VSSSLPLDPDRDRTVDECSDRLDMGLAIDAALAEFPALYVSVLQQEELDQSGQSEGVLIDEKAARFSRGLHLPAGSRRPIRSQAPCRVWWQLGNLCS
jgi:hypothetical protein